MKSILASLLLFISANAAATCENITFSGNRAGVPAGEATAEMHGFWTFTPQAPWHVATGYYVPAGKFLGITLIVFSEKHIQTNGNYRNSYMIFKDLFTVTGDQPVVVFSKPMALPPGFLFTGWIINNTGESQNMNFLIDGYLSDDPLFKDCK